MKSEATHKLIDPNQSQSLSLSPSHTPRKFFIGIRNNPNPTRFLLKLTNEEKYVFQLVFLLQVFSPPFPVMNVGRLIGSVSPRTVCILYRFPFSEVTLMLLVLSRLL